MICSNALGINGLSKWGGVKGSVDNRKAASSSESLVSNGKRPVTSHRWRLQRINIRSRVGAEPCACWRKVWGDPQTTSCFSCGSMVDNALAIPKSVIFKRLSRVTNILCVLHHNVRFLLDARILEPRRACKMSGMPSSTEKICFSRILGLEISPFHKLPSDKKPLRQNPNHKVVTMFGWVRLAVTWLLAWNAARKTCPLEIFSENLMATGSFLMV